MQGRRKWGKMDVRRLGRGRKLESLQAQALIRMFWKSSYRIEICLLARATAVIDCSVSH